MGKGGGESTQSSEPWEAQKPYLLQGFERAEDIYQDPLEFFPGQTYVDFSPESEAALGGMTGRAQAGSPLLQGAQDYTGSVLGGDFLSPESNPFFGQVADSIMSQVEPAVAQRFGGAGRTGTSPSAHEALGRGVSRGLAPYAYGAYGQERGIQEAAASRAPGLAQADYADLARLRAVGAEREGMAGQQLGDEMARFGFEQNEPQARLEQYMRQIQGQYGGTSVTEGPGTNPLLLGTGAALSLAGMPTSGGGSLLASGMGK